MEGKILALKNGGHKHKIFGNTLKSISFELDLRKGQETRHGYRKGQYACVGRRLVSFLENCRVVPEQAQLKVFIEYY